MSRSNDMEYFERREDEERSRAERCGDPTVAAIHRELARRYAERLRGLVAEPVRRPRLTIAYAAA